MESDTTAAEAFVKGLAQGLLAAWPLLAVIGAIVSVIIVVRVVVALLQWQRLAHSGINEIDRMDGKTFERFLKVLFTRLGYDVQLTRLVGDYGADLIVARDGKKSLIQAKRSKNNLGVKAIQQAVAAKPIYGVTAAIVVSNAYFTRQAQRLARANKVTLWDRKKLMNAMLRVRPLEKDRQKQPEREEVDRQPLPQDAATPTVAYHCARCGKPLSNKVREYCLARQERFGGRVYCFDHQRS